MALTPSTSWPRTTTPPPTPEPRITPNTTCAPTPAPSTASREREAVGVVGDLDRARQRVGEVASAGRARAARSSCRRRPRRCRDRPRRERRCRRARPPRRPRPRAAASGRGSRGRSPRSRGAASAPGRGRARRRRRPSTTPSILVPPKSNPSRMRRPPDPVFPRSTGAPVPRNTAIAAGGRRRIDLCHHAGAMLHPPPRSGSAMFGSTFNRLWKIGRIGMVPPAPAPGRHGLAIALIVRDEARAHRRVGRVPPPRRGAAVPVYDNGCTDATHADPARRRLGDAADRRALAPGASPTPGWGARSTTRCWPTPMPPRTSAAPSAGWPSSTPTSSWCRSGARPSRRGAGAPRRARATSRCPGTCSAAPGTPTPPDGGVLRNYLRRAARPDERRARGARVQVPGRSLPPDRGPACIPWRPTAAAATANDRGEVGPSETRPRAARLLFGRSPAAQPLLHPVGGGAGGEDRPRAEPRRQVAGVRAQGAAHRRQHRGATRSRTARRSTISRGSTRPRPCAAS